MSKLDIRKKPSLHSDSVFDAACSRVGDVTGIRHVLRYMWPGTYPPYEREMRITMLSPIDMHKIGNGNEAKTIAQE